MTIDITFNPLEKLRRKLPLFVGGAIFLFGVFHVLTAVFATPPTSSYTPGETMSPSCAPGDTNCRVALIAGSILFSDGNTLISQDNSNLYWDDTNNRLGVGTTSPTNRLHIEGVNGGSAGIYLNNAIPSSTSYTLYNNSGTLIWNGNTVAMGSSFSGTTNRIPKFTTSSSIGDSVIYELSGNVGIGTTTPETSLHVLRSTASTNIPVVAAILGMSTSGTAAAGLGSFLNFNIEDDAGSMRGGGGFGSYWKSAANAAPQANLYVEDNAGTDIMTWQYGGNVGIGTTSPLLKFDVAGSGRFTGAATTVLTGSIDPAASTTVTGVGTLFLTELVIGDRITVTGETRTVTAIATNTSLTVDTAFSDNANDISPDKLAAIFLARDSSNAVKMVMNDLGNVGIGTSTPSALLNVYLTGAGATGLGDIVRLARSGNEPTMLIGSMGGLGSDPYMSFITDGNIGFITGNSSLNGDVRYDSKMVIKTTGNVGIGTTTPGSKLDITTNALGTTQTTSSGLALVNTTAAAAGLQQISPAVRWSGFGWKTDATAASQAVDFRSYVVPVQGTANPTGYLSFGSSVNGAAYSDGQMVLTGTGNVGIGTTGPLNKFHVRNGAGTAVTGNGNTAKDVLIEGATDVFTSVNPNLGIVANSAQAANNMATLGFGAKYSAQNYTFFGAIGGIDEDGSGTPSGALAFATRTGGGQMLEKMRINNLGNVGIGDATPTEALLVVGNAGAGDIYATFAASANAETLCWDASGASLITDCTSLRKFKENVTDLNLPGIETIMKLSPREFDWIGKEDGIRHDLGFIAEEVDAVSPLLASYSIRDSEKGAELNGVKYERLTALLTKAIQEQQTQIEGINLKIEDLEAKIQSYSESIQTSTSTFQIQDVFSQILVWLEDKVVKVKELTTETIVVDKASINELSVKKITVENGINIKDSITGNIWCIGIANGEWSKVSGECVTAPAELQIQTGEVEPPAEVQPQEEEIASPPEAPRNDNDDSQPQEEEIIDTQGQTSGSGEVDN